MSAALGSVSSQKRRTEGPKLQAGPGARIAEFGSPVTLENLRGAWLTGHTRERFVECVLVSCGRCNEAPRPVVENNRSSGARV